MPEAVASNSTTAPKRNPASVVLDALEQIQHRLTALAHMVGETLDNSELIEIGVGARSLFDKEVESIKNVRSLLLADVFRLQALFPETSRKPSFITGLAERITKMRVEAANEAGYELPEYFSDWSEEQKGRVFYPTYDQYNELLERANGSTDLLEIGSMLPWLELKIRKEFGLSTGYEMSPQVADDLYADPKNLRDQFIAEKIKEGYSLAHISQSLNVKISAIEKAMQRMATPSQKESATKVA
ncbi:hypothetical protein [Brucella anthropi]|uniref:hypothetical protein n=1 Tax=Brucella anthropi TaxID=529 RepID=UPI00124D6863|nr:hypothetical protein [Brucella anthropi]KAB2752254.1 hypothetical protein F9L05_03840 [Brucella anthropi]